MPDRYQQFAARPNSALDGLIAMFEKIIGDDPAYD